MRPSLILRRSSPLLILLAAIAIGQVLIAGKQEQEKKPTEVLLPTVSTITVQPESIRFKVDSYGLVQAKHQTQIVSEVQGRLLQLSPNLVAGGFVEKGEALAQLESFDYQADLIQAEANLAQAQARLEEEVARGEVAKKDWAHLSPNEAPTLGLRLPQLKQEQANVAFAEASVQRAQRNLERTTIRAPFSGLVKSRQVSNGQYLTMGSVIAEIYDTQVAEVRLPVANHEHAYLSTLEHSQTELRSSFGGQDVIWQAQIVRSEGVIDAQNRMLYLVAEIQDPYLLNGHSEQQLPLNLGSFVNASITGKSVDNIVVLPRNLIQNGQVMMIGPDNRVFFRTVNIVRESQQYSYIHSSFEAGEIVSATRINGLESGDQVRIAEPSVAAKLEEQQ